ncbi:hypothetical protein MBT84_02815 [Streptomyces sp. MBT84]|nr:hypothetical protein [Streptomyces sp. MBT84]
MQGFRNADNQRLRTRCVTTRRAPRTPLHRSTLKTPHADPGRVPGRAELPRRGEPLRMVPIHSSQPRRAAWAAAWKRVSAPSSAIRRWIRRWVVR